MKTEGKEYQLEHIKLQMSVLRRQDHMFTGLANPS